MKTREENIERWYLEGKQSFEKWKETKEEKFWTIFECCAACLCEFDRSHKDNRTQDLQSKNWFWAVVRGETSLERYQKSGYFNEKIYEILEEKA